MERLGFDLKWRSLIMLCITSVAYSITINGKPKGHIIPSRGIRQGNPLSPYFFFFLVVCKGIFGSNSIGGGEWTDGRDCCTLWGS